MVVVLCLTPIGVETAIIIALGVQRALARSGIDKEHCPNIASGIMLSLRHLIQVITLRFMLTDDLEPKSKVGVSN